MSIARLVPGVASEAATYASATALPSVGERVPLVTMPTVAPSYTTAYP
jgi:hypothetical protein